MWNKSSAFILTLAFLSVLLILQIIPAFKETSIYWAVLYLAEPIALLIVALAAFFKARERNENLEPLFWLLITAAFSTWLLFDIVRYFFQGPKTNSGLIADISYFVFCALMVSAIEVKSFTNVRKTVNKRNLITSLSLFSFLIGAFSYFILAPSESSKMQNSHNNSFYFYAMMDCYLFIRWWHIAYQESPSFRLSYLFLGGASAVWLIDDFIRVSSVSQSPSNWQWLNFLPFLLLCLAIHFNKSANSKVAKPHYFRRYHIFNSPIFFLGIILIIVITFDKFLLIEKSTAVLNTEIVWVVIMLVLSLLQVFGLLETNKNRKIEIANISQSNSKILKDLEERTKQLDHQVKNNQAILDSINNPILTLRLTGEILTCNSATQTLLGYPESNLIGRCFSELVPETEEFHHFFDYQSYRQQLAKNNQGLELESKLICWSGEHLIVHISLSQGQSFTRDKIIVSIADIREQKQAEQQLLDLRDEFTANISHEFRTPLTIVNGIVDELIATPNLKEQLPVLEIAKRNNLRLIHMVDQLLELSRVNSESIKIVDLDASDWVKPLCLSYQTIAKDKNIDFHCAICDSIFIRGNQQAFEKILYNLLSNAFKYTKTGGSVNVALEEQEKVYRLVVADTGIGISKQEQANIFDRFQRSENVSEYAVPGVGIGLSLVKDLVKTLGWQLSLSSTVNKGSQFTVEILKAKNPQQLIKKQGEATLNFQQLESTEQLINKTEPTVVQKKSKYMVLVIEDNFDMQRHLESILSPHHQCLVASNGSQGLSMAEEFLPDLIICDVMMPGIDGFEVLQKLKSHSVTSHIPVIMLTAKTDRKSKIRGLKKEAEDYLGKPFDAEELLIKLNNQINLRRKLQQRYEAQWTGFSQSSFQQGGLEERPPENEFLLELNQHFEQCYSDPELTMTHLANKLAMSDRQLQRKVKALVDVSPLELLKRYRLEKAKQQLKQKVQIGLVAQACGFSSQTYFGRCFKEHFGVTPKVFQQSS